MLEVISAMASLVEISSLAYTGGRWVRQRVQNWKVPSSAGIIDNKFKFSIEYYPLVKDAGLWRKFKLGKESFREEKRLLHDKTRLIEYYPGITEKLLVDKRIGQVPYEVIGFKPKEMKLGISDSQFEVCSALRGVYEETYNNLIKHYRIFGIQYEATLLVRACDWNGTKLTIERTEYPEAASTNMIADLDIEKISKKTVLLEDSLEKSDTIRMYDFSLTDSEGCYPSLNKSSLANPIGVAGVAITADNRLVLIHRPRSVSTYAYKLGPSSSGYVTWHDLKSQNEEDLNLLLVTGLKREIAEELHLDLSRDISELHPLGFFRELYRAGMPQAFYCFRVHLTAENLVSRMRDAQDFQECIGVLCVPVNRLTMPKVIATLVRAQKVGMLNIGLEAQGLLTALALNGEDFLFTRSGV